MSRPVAVTCPHCGVVLEVEIPVPLDGRGVVRVSLPDHVAPVPSHQTIQITFELAGAAIVADLRPLCALSGARLTAGAADVGRAVDADLRRT